MLYAAIQNFSGLIVAAAGNGGLDSVGDQHSSGSYNVYPCDFDLANVICATASTQSDTLASFSDYGSGYVDIAAPGFNITSLAFS